MSNRHPIVWLLATPLALILTAYALADFTAFAIVVGGVLWAAGVVGGIAAMTHAGEQRKLRKAAERRGEDLESELAERDDALTATHLAVRALNNENTRLHMLLTEAQIAGGKVLPFPSIPTQRVPVADIDIPVHTVVDEDELTALMRATEERS